MKDNKHIGFNPMAFGANTVKPMKGNEELNQQLRETLSAYGEREYLLGESGSMMGETLEETITKVKKLFIKSGYIKRPSVEFMAKNIYQTIKDFYPLRFMEIGDVVNALKHWKEKSLIIAQSLWDKLGEDKV